MKIILFDSACKLCDKTIRRILRADKKEVFHFAALQSSVGKELRAKFNLSPDSVALIDEQRAYIRSNAVLRICRYLPTYRWVLAGYIIPTPLRDGLYRCVAAHRHLWDGRQNDCMVATPALKKRFLDD